MGKEEVRSFSLRVTLKLEGFLSLCMFGWKIIIIREEFGQ